MRRLLLIAVAGLALAGPAYAEGMAGMKMPATTPTQAAATMVPDQVVIDDFAFAPKVITVAVGTTLTWINNDNEPHTVTATGEKPAFGSPPMDTGDKYSFTFDKPGTYNYYCTVHPHMQGTVIVK